MALAVVQHSSGILNAGIPGAITLGSAPTPGNILVLFVHCNIASGSQTVNTSFWTDWQDAVQGGSLVGQLLYRYVQSGDTTTTGAVWTAGSTYWAYDIYEVSGVTGTLATDALTPTNASTGTIGAASSLSAPSITTTQANAVALFGAGQYDGSANPSESSGGWTLDETQHNAAFYGSTGAGSQAVATSGTTVNCTVQFNASNNPCNLYLVVLQAPSGVSATGSGSIGTMTETAPTGVAGESATGSGAIGTMTETAPTGVPFADQTVFAAMPPALVETAPTGQALAVSVAQGAIGTMTETAPEASAFGSGVPVNTTQTVLKVIFDEVLPVRTTQTVLKVLYTEQQVPPPPVSANVSVFIQETLLPSTDGSLEEAFPCPWPSANP